MKRRSVPTIITLSSLLLMAQSGTLLLAADHSHAHGHEAEYETHDAHEHGRATLSLVADNQKLSFQLESPAMNIVGFEHAANTKEDQQKVEHALSGEHAQQAEHREFVVEYNATCQLTNDIREIDFQLLKLFSGIEQLDVQYIYAGKQGSVSLNPKQTALEF